MEAKDLNQMTEEEFRDYLHTKERYKIVSEMSDNMIKNLPKEKSQPYQTLIEKIASLLKLKKQK